MRKVIPGIIYADDILLLAHTWTQLKQLLQITTEVGDELRLVFNPKKSAIIDSNEPESVINPGLEIQGQRIPMERRST